PSRWRIAITFDQPEASANAPWTSTIVGLARPAGPAWAARWLPRLVTISAVMSTLVVLGIYALLRDLKPARSSVTNVSGCSHAAKCVPLGRRVYRSSLGYPASAPLCGA